MLPIGDDDAQWEGASNASDDEAMSVDLASVHSSDDDDDDATEITKSRENAAVAAMYASGDQRAAERLQRMKPKNTKKTYKGPLQEWKKFCEQWSFADGEDVTEDKLVAFLEQCVIYRRKKVKLKFHSKALFQPRL